MQVSAVAAPALLTHGLRPESPLLLTKDHFLRSLLPQGVPDGLPAERAAIHPPCICTSGGCPHLPPSLPGLSHLYAPWPSAPQEAVALSPVGSCGVK